MKKTANDWLAILVDAGRQRGDIVPEGWKTIPQIAKETGRSDSHTRVLIRRAIQIGAVQEARFTIKTGNKTYPVVHYKIGK